MGIEALRIRMEEVESVKVAERNRRIDGLVTNAMSRGEDSDRLFWTIVHDLEHAPQTTNLEQLEQLGFDVPSLRELSRLGPAESAEYLRMLLDAMSVLRVFIRGAEHLSNRGLLNHLIQVVLRESVADLPHSLSSRQWVDLSDVIE